MSQLPVTPGNFFNVTVYNNVHNCNLVGNSVCPLALLPCAVELNRFIVQAELGTETIKSLNK